MVLNGTIFSGTSVRKLRLSSFNFDRGVRNKLLDRADEYDLLRVSCRQFKNSRHRPTFSLGCAEQNQK
jgi:hypothetical protein